MQGEADPSQFMPRIVPTPCHSQALEGTWKLNGDTVRLYQEPDTGVLIALDSEGRQVNPLKVISRGRKLEEPS